MDGKIVYTDGREEILKYGILEIPAKAYYENKNIVSVVLPNSVKIIGKSAFDGCTGLASISMSSSLITIDGGAFYSCSSLVNVRIPDKITSIRGYAFGNCINLISINIPNSVTFIGRVCSFCRYMLSFLNGQ